MSQVFSGRTVPVPCSGPRTVASFSPRSHGGFGSRWWPAGEHALLARPGSDRSFLGVGSQCTNERAPLSRGSLATALVGRAHVGARPSCYAATSDGWSSSAGAAARNSSSQMAAEPVSCSGLCPHAMTHEAGGVGSPTTRLRSSVAVASSSASGPGAGLARPTLSRRWSSYAS